MAEQTEEYMNVDASRPARAGRHPLDMVSLVSGLLLLGLCGLLLAAEAGADAVSLTAAGVTGFGVLMLLVVMRPRPGRRPTTADRSTGLDANREDAPTPDERASEVDADERVPAEPAAAAEPPTWA